MIIYEPRNIGLPLVANPVYGAETWAVKKTQEKKLDVAEMRMLR